MSYISVGCNKGYDAIDTARMGMSNTNFNKTSWRESFEVEMDSGVCGQAVIEDPSLFDIQHNPIKKAEMHCIEPLPTTFDVISKSSQKLGLDREGLVLSKAAISSSNGHIRFPKATEGSEGFAINYCEYHPFKSCEEVPIYSLQTSVNKFVKSPGPINILSIDAEGFDFDVLFGAGDALGRTEFLEFEFHNTGDWLKYSIMDPVNLLDAQGFNCYFHGVQERLWRLTRCHHEFYDTFHGWSNVICVHRSQEELATRMENIFLETLKVRNYRQ